MVDLHTHILPGVDDGLSDWSEFISATRDAKANGIDKIVATPHVYNGSLNAEKIEEKLKAGIDKTNAELYFGAEINILWAFGKDYDLLRMFTLNKNGRSLLIELPYSGAIMGLNDFLWRLRSAGFIPIISHVERYPYLKMADYQELKRLGIYLQANIGSFWGQYGRQARVNGEQLLQNGLVCALASDLHKSSDYQNLTDTLKNKIGKIIDQENLASLINDYPEKLLNGEEIA